MQQLSADQEEIRSIIHRLELLEKKKDNLTLICFSGDWDKLFATFTIAIGSASMGKKVAIFFTFWGAAAIKNAPYPDNHQIYWLQSIFQEMLPKSIDRAPLSRMNMFGLGRFAVIKLVKRYKMQKLGEMLKEAQELGVEFYLCETSLKLLGLSVEQFNSDLMPKWCGVCSFLSMAERSEITLFI